jgi:hypothetical protein
MNKNMRRCCPEECMNKIQLSCAEEEGSDEEESSDTTSGKGRVQVVNQIRRLGNGQARGFRVRDS